MEEVQNLLDMGFTFDRIQKAMDKTNYRGYAAALEYLLAHEQDETSEDNVAGGGDDFAVLSEFYRTLNRNAAMQRQQLEAVQQGQLWKCQCCNEVVRGQAAKDSHLIQTGHSRYVEWAEPERDVFVDSASTEIDHRRGRCRLACKDEHRRCGALGSGSTELSQDESELGTTEMEASVDSRRNYHRVGNCGRCHHMPDMESICSNMDVMLDRARLKRRRLEQKRMNRKCKLSRTDSESSQAKYMSATAAAMMLPSHLEGDEVNSLELNSRPINWPSGDSTKMTRIKVRMPDGTAVMQPFHIAQRLCGVRAFIEITAGVKDNYRLMTNFPKRIFKPSDDLKTLKQLSLYPTAVLIVCPGKGQPLTSSSPEAD